VAVSHDNRLRVWDTATGTTRFSFQNPDHLSKIYSAMDISMDSKCLALGTTTGSIEVFDLNSGEIIIEFSGVHKGKVTAVAFSFTGKSLFSSASDKIVVEWSIESKSFVK
jgi:WD40 repeat protein